MKFLLLFSAAVLVLLGVMALASYDSSSDSDALFGDCFLSGCDSTEPADSSGSAPTNELTLTLQPDVNTHRFERCVIATLLDASGVYPVSDQIVSFSVPKAVGTQARPLKGSDRSDGNGQATFCSTASPPFVIDEIHAFGDTDGNGLQDVGEPGATD